MQKVFNEIDDQTTQEDIPIQLNLPVSDVDGPFLILEAVHDSDYPENLEFSFSLSFPTN